MRWKDFLYSTRSERQGIIVLVVLIIIVYSASLFHWTDDSTPIDPAEQEKFEQEYNEFIASIKEVEPQYRKFDKRSTNNHSYPPQEIHLSTFDPNTADSLTFLSLGLPSWMAKNILRYRSKQGTFRHPEDFRKIYGMKEEQYQTLLPYIRIADKYKTKDTLRLLSAQAHEAHRDTLFKYKPGTVISLNEADTTELKKIPGIGSGIARMIVNYRRKLGGFYRIEQLQEINLKAELLRPWFSIDTHRIKAINLNKAGLERLTHHPYINFYQAKVIVEYRKKKGNLKNLKQLSLYEEFTAEDLERIANYVCCDI